MLEKTRRWNNAQRLLRLLILLDIPHRVLPQLFLIKVDMQKTQLIRNNVSDPSRKGISWPYQDSNSPLNCFANWKQLKTSIKLTFISSFPRLFWIYFNVIVFFEITQT